MKASLRPGVLAASVCLLIALAAPPASAQVETVYTGLAPPSVGAVLSNTGQRTVTPAVSPQVLPLQVSSGAVAGTQQARVQGLAFTGADIVTLVAMGLSAIAIGVVLNRRARPRSTPQE